MTTPLGSPKKKLNSVKAQANAQEKKLAKKLGGIRQPQSGATDKHKGDIKLEDFLLDSKQTINNSILVTTKDLVKICHEAHQDQRDPGLILTLNTPTHVPSEWAVIPLTVFIEVLERLRNE